MNEFKQLEFDKVKNCIAGLAESDITKKFISTVNPCTKKDVIETKLKTFAEFKEFIDEYSAVSCERLVDIRDMFKHLIFNFEELSRIYYSLKMANEFKTKIRMIDDENYFKNIISISKSITLLIDLERRFTEIFNEKGEILDCASSKLETIRRKKTKLETVSLVL